MGAIPNKGSNKHSCSAKQANNADDGEYDCLIIKVDQKVLTCEEHEKPHPALAGRRLLAVVHIAAQEDIISFWGSNDVKVHCLL